MNILGMLKRDKLKGYLSVRCIDCLTETKVNTMLSELLIDAARVFLDEGWTIETADRRSDRLKESLIGRCPECSQRDARGH